MSILDYVRRKKATAKHRAFSKQAKLHGVDEAKAEAYYKQRQRDVFADKMKAEREYETTRARERVERGPAIKRAGQAIGKRLKERKKMRRTPTGPAYSPQRMSLGSEGFSTEIKKEAFDLGASKVERTEVKKTPFTLGNGKGPKFGL